ncbi:Major facilitator superfamily domain-containing protein 6 [Dufourea novaeangliae]|uniref:Major facilitator superfamily domain-containing protein 6 n=1 Tax=Dufourea novaeangliae TaxID=178035 RepID=A0A154PQ51_DUFNO|nr:Major facilitator superfamily domain-containing protein 6 [Dufourea novaeangliae]
MTITASTERMETTKGLPKMKFINANLLSLKLLLFLFFGVKSYSQEWAASKIRMISMISPAIAIVGPLIASPIADKLAGHQGRNKSSTGRYLRVMIAIACILSAIFYAFLLIIPSVDHVELPKGRRPGLKFNCDQTGAVVLQERCKDRVSCHRWFDDTRAGPLLLEDCNYACYPVGSKRWRTDNDGFTASGTIDSDIGVLDGSGDTTVIPLESEMYTQEQEESKKNRRFAMADSEPPHLCYKEGDSVVCHVYTEYTGNLALNATLGQALNNESDREWCAYPLAEYFACRIPPELKARMAEVYQSCSIECNLVDPYTLPDSVFIESQCQRTEDWSHLVFWTYLTIRSVADIFPTTAVTLIDAAVVIATRETSCGRGDVGRQLAFGSLGFAIFGPVTGYLCTLLENLNSFYYLPIALHVAMMLLTALVAICANGMPLSPPEWWWHTRSGMLALPMSAIKRYGSETAALVIILIVMGTFWSAMDSYLPLHLQKLGGNELPIGVAMTVGAIPAFLFLWKSEHLVDYCGHSNLLITAFTVYIIRFTGLSLVSGPWWSLISEALEVFTLGIMWVTAILYLRHLVPRHLTVTAQALPVIAHFCIGRCTGAVIGAYINVDDSDIVDSLRFVYRCMAIAAAAVAALYFVLYHGLLKPRCHAHTIQGPRQPPTVVQGKHNYQYRYGSNCN